MKNEQEQKILETICSQMNVPVNSIFQTTRLRPICEARQMFMYWLKENTDYSLSYIGKVVRTVPLKHPTVIRAIRIMKNLIKNDARLKTIWASVNCKPFTSLKYRPK